MKILYLILDGFPTFRPDIASLWGKYLARVGVTCDISTVQLQADMSDTTWESGKRFLYQPSGGKVAEQLGSFIHDCKVLWNVKPGEYDAIQVRDKSFICLPALWAARRLGIPFFYWMSFPMAESLARTASQIDWKRNFPRWIFLSFRGRFGGYFLRQFALPKTDHIFVQSDRMLEDVAALGISRSKMTAVPMCIDPDRFQTPLEKPNLPILFRKSSRVVGYLGECSRVRRIDFLFEAIAIVKRSIPEIFFLIVGDAYEEADKKWLRETISLYELQDNVRISGWVSAKQALVEFSCVEVALALTPPDPLLDCASPTKLVEYLAMQRAVVANDHPDHRHVIDHGNSGLCTPFEVSAYAAAIVTLLSEPDKCRAYAVNGRNWVMNHRSYSHMANELNSVYSRLCFPPVDSSNELVPK